MGNGESPAESVAKKVPLEAIDEKKVMAGLRLCYIALGFVGGIAVIIIAYFILATHSLKPLAQPLTEESLKLYREARSIVVDDILKVSDRLLGSVLVPILTLLLGYIFGSREDRTSSKEGD